MKKSLDTTKIVNELEESAFFRHKKQPDVSKSDDATTRRTDDTTMRRIIKRQAMDFYQDQLKILSRHSLEQKLAGKSIGMSQMIREAIDEYLEKKELR